MKIALSTDHAGFDDLPKLQTFLESQGHVCVNFGPQALDMADDYPDFIFPAARAVASGECELGIIWGGSGQGEAMVANRVKGVRCVVYYGPAKAKRAINAEGDSAQDDLEILRLAREHNNSNMLSLGARFLDQQDIEQAVNIWLATPHVGLERHTRRIKKIDLP
ncbi:MAG: RpiB/LacA/LacB family sugar-phosphate isomerase [Patescibacteria group bacterium]